MKTEIAKNLKGKFRLYFQNIRFPEDEDSLKEINLKYLAAFNNDTTIEFYCPKRTAASKATIISESDLEQIVLVSRNPIKTQAIPKQQIRDVVLDLDRPNIIGLATETLYSTRTEGDQIVTVLRMPMVRLYYIKVIMSILSARRYLCSHFFPCFS